MNREEAIRRIQDIERCTPIHTREDARDFEALEMAIKALEQEPCGDAISRKIISAFLSGLISDETERKKALEYINELPPVNPTNTGHWIEHPEIETSTPEYLMFYECSECGDRQCFCKSDIHKKRFCSNCGCRMVEPQESEKV